MAGRPDPAVLRRARREGEGSVPVYVQALLEQTAENMENLQRILARGEDGRAQANQAVLALTERVATLSDTMRTSQQLMLRIAEAQAALAPALQRLGEQRPRQRLRRCRARAICATSNCICSGCWPKRAGPRAEHRRAAQRPAHADPHGRRAGRGAAA